VGRMGGWNDREMWEKGSGNRRVGRGGWGGEGGEGPGEEEWGRD